MEIRNSAEGLKTLLGVASSNPSQGATASQGKTGTAAGGEVFPGDTATLSSAAKQAFQALDGSGNRMDKILAVQTALTAGGYSAPASLVANRLVDAMLGGQLPAR
ncbi:MAG TPA: hypothetical protein VMV57_10955 [Terracidiphilus sp.]|nr:hypothetical protein [Terracidiphilus sp.]